MKPLILEAAGGDADGVFVVALIVCGIVAVVLPVLVLLMLWAGTTVWALASLRAYPRLVPTDSRGHTCWCAAACVPLIGPAAYAVALSCRRVMLGRAGWREARSHPRGVIPQPPPRPD